MRNRVTQLLYHLFFLYYLLIWKLIHALVIPIFYYAYMYIMFKIYDKKFLKYYCL